MRRAHGFTLLELLVSLLILGLLAAVVLLSLPERREARLETEAERLRVLLQQAREEAIYTGRDLGLALSAGGYRFNRAEQGRWQALESPKALLPRSLPEPLTLTDLQIDNEPLPLEQSPPTRPQILLLSDGQITPFALALTDDAGARIRLSGGGSGSLRLESP